MLFLKTFKGAKFLVDGNAFQTFFTLSTKNLSNANAILFIFVIFKTENYIEKQESEISLH